MFQLLKNWMCATPNIAFACVAASGLLSFPSLAAQVNGQFNVTVTLIPAPAKPSTPPIVTPGQPVIVPPGLPVSAFCKKDNLPNAHGAVVTVVCTTGAVVAIEPGTTPGHAFTPMHGGSYRYVTQVNPSADVIDTSSTFSGAGTTTAWRVVHHSGRDYLEMTLGW